MRPGSHRSTAGCLPGCRARTDPSFHPQCLLEPAAKGISFGGLSSGLPGMSTPVHPELWAKYNIVSALCKSDLNWFSILWSFIVHGRHAQLAAEQGPVHTWHIELQLKLNSKHLLTIFEIQLTIEHGQMTESDIFRPITWCDHIIRSGRSRWLC